VIVAVAVASDVATREPERQTIGSAARD